MDISVTGGRAHWDGVSFQSDTVYARATLKNGAITSNVKQKEHRIYEKVNFLQTVPFVRGIAILFDTLLQSPLLLILVVAANLSTLVTLIRDILQGNFTQSMFTGISQAGYSLLLIACILILLRFSVLAKFHGAEHMAFNALRKGVELTTENVRMMSRISHSCGTNVFIFGFLIYEVLLFIFPSSTIFHLLISYSIGYEIFLVEHTHWWVRPFYLFGELIQKYLATAVPTDKQLETAIAALKEVK